MSDCLFCKIIAGEIPGAKVYEDDEVFAFRDINPEAPVHILVTPKAHIESVDDIHGRDEAHFVAKIFEAIPKIAKSEGLVSGYRVIANNGPDAHQSVRHLHFHVLGGCDLGAKVL